MDSAEIAREIQLEVKKAVTASTYTMDPPARSIYSPENLDPVVKILVPTATPIRNSFARTDGFGEAAEWNKLTSRLDNDSGGTMVAVSFADAGQPNQTTQTTAFTAAKYKNLGRDVEIGRQQIAANRGSRLEDVRASQEMIKTFEVLLGEENMLLNGDATADTLAFDGLGKSLTTNSGTSGLLSASGVSSYAQTLYVAGADMVNKLIANPRQVRALADQLESSGSIQRVVIDNQGAATGGYHMSKIVDGNTGNMIDVISSRYAKGWAYLLETVSPAGENYIEVQDLEKMSIYDVPTANHSIQSRVYETCVLKVVAEVFQYKIGGLATS